MAKKAKKKNKKAKTKNAKKDLKVIAKMMRHLDYCMMTTISDQGMTASRPMSNNGDVKYNGNSYFFTWEKSHLVKDLSGNSHVNLSFQGPKSLYLSISGRASLVRDKNDMKDHWVPDLETYFEDGLDTKGIVMIAVKAKRITYWQKEEEGEIVL